MERNDSYGSASRDALLARRAAAARRRATLTLGLVVLTGLVGVLVATTALPVWTVAVPGVLLVTVLVLGRRAVLANARADRAAREREAAREAARPAALRRAGRPAPAVRTSVTGRAVHPSQTQTEMISRVAVEASGKARKAEVRVPSAAPVSTATPASTVTAAASAADEVQAEQDSPRPAQTTTPATGAALEAGADWVPVAVPRPVYTMKSAAPRWEPAPLTAELRKLTDERRAELAVADDAPEATVGPSVTAADEPSEDSLGVNLNSVLARRRAAGE